MRWQTSVLRLYTQTRTLPPSVVPKNYYGVILWCVALPEPMISDTGVPGLCLYSEASPSFINNLNSA